MKWRCDLGIIGANQGHSIKPRNDGACFFWNYIDDDVYEISTTGTLGSAIDTDARLMVIIELSYASKFWQSILGSYAVMTDVDRDCVLISKEGVVLHDRDVDEDKGEFTFDTTSPILIVAISPNGKYIAVLVEKDDHDAVILMYEGS